MNTKTITIAVLSIIAVFGLLLAVYFLINTPKQTVFPEVNQILNTDHVKWAKNSKNILVEYSDFQCPACREFEKFIKKEIEATGSGGFEATKKVAFVFRHFPLYQIHPNAFELAYAAEAAGKQNKFFEMADLLFNENQPPLELANKIGLNIEKFKKDLASKEVKDKVEADLKSGENAGVNATPTFFLNGKKLEITSYDELKKLLVGL